VALVSNTNDFHFSYCTREFGFLDMIRKRYLSYQIRALKPSPAYYQHVLRDLGVDPSHALFVDDLAENVDGAVRVGMRGHEFVGGQELRQELRVHLERNV
jgi:putative hydrolase of the HAD superfamily